MSGASATGLRAAAPSRASWIRGMRAVLRRELSAAFDSPIAYVAVIAALLGTTSWFMNEFFLTAKLDMRPFFEIVPWALALFAPALGMRSWSEDLKTRTFELWRALPLSGAQVALGKYAATLVVHALFLAGTTSIVVLLVALGRPDLGAIAAGYLGAFLLGAELLAIANCVSSRTPDQISAFLVSSLAAFALLALGEPRVVAVLDGLAPELGAGTFLAATVSPLVPYRAFVGGFVPLAGVLHATLVSAAFVWLTARSVSSERP